MNQVFIQKLIPENFSKFPRDTRTVTIQLDGASAHSIESDNDIKTMKETNLPVFITKQNPQNPDLNVLDLEYFTSIQGLQNKKY